jgi:hypothetical protein
LSFSEGESDGNSPAGKAGTEVMEIAGKRLKTAVSGTVNSRIIVERIFYGQ